MTTKIEPLLDGEMTADPSWGDAGAVLMWRPTPESRWINTPYKVGHGSVEMVALAVSQWVVSHRILHPTTPRGS